MKKAISMYRPSIKRKDLEYVLNCMMNDRIDYGEFAQNLESRLKKRVNCNNVIVTNSYYSAFDLILDAMEIKEGDEIILPSFAPQMFLNVVLKKKAVPVLVDLEENALQPSIESVKNAKTDKTKVMLIYYYFGYTFDPRPFLNIVPSIIEDISSVMGAQYGEAYMGSHSVFSIADFSTKGLITTGEGSAVFCNDRKSYNNIYSLLEIGYSDVDYSPRAACMMPDLNAAMGVSQDETLNKRLRLRNQIGEIYEEAVRRSKGASLLQEGDEKRFYTDFPVFIKRSLKDVIQYFDKNKIEVSRPFAFPLHHYLNLPKMYFPNTENYYLHSLLVPIYSILLKKDVDLLAKILASLI